MGSLFLLLRKYELMFLADFTSEELLFYYLLRKVLSRPGKFASGES